MKLKKRFVQSQTIDGLDKIRSSLKVLSEESWESVIREFGDPEVRHLTVGGLRLRSRSVGRSSWGKESN